LREEKITDQKKATVDWGCNSVTEQTVNQDLCKVVCLVSGGIDSPVAAWLFIKRGYTPIFVFYDNYPFSDENTKKRALDIIKKLSEFAPQRPVKVYIIPHGENLADILRNCPRNLTCVICRRIMYRVAEKVATIEEAETIVTGEIIGEHASQTLRNLRVENDVLTEFSVLRPLIGMNKLEVEHLAKKIGTFDTSASPVSCCSASPSRPRTRARLDEVRKAERKLSIEDMVRRGIEKVEVILF